MTINNISYKYKDLAEDAIKKKFVNNILGIYQTRKYFQQGELAFIGDKGYVVYISYIIKEKNNIKEILDNRNFICVFDLKTASCEAFAMPLEYISSFYNYRFKAVNGVLYIVNGQFDAEWHTYDIETGTATACQRPEPEETQNVYDVVITDDIVTVVKGQEVKTFDKEKDIEKLPAFVALNELRSSDDLAIAWGELGFSYQNGDKLFFVFIEEENLLSWLGGLFIPMVFEYHFENGSFSYIGVLSMASDRSIYIISK